MILDDWFYVLFLLVGGGFLVAGFAIRIWVDRRRFYRRGPGGLQHFSGYFRAVVFSFFEKILMLISIPMIILGIVVLFFSAILVIERGKYQPKENLEKGDGIGSNAGIHILEEEVP